MILEKLTLLQLRFEAISTQICDETRQLLGNLKLPDFACGGGTPQLTIAATKPGTAPRVPNQ